MKTQYFMPNKQIHDEPGYSIKSQCILESHPELNIDKVLKNPTENEISMAKKIILELLVDFPFVSEAEKSHAIALIILPFVRGLINGPTPLHLIEASTPGTGKTLLAYAVTLIFLGFEVPTMTESRSDEEWRKKITAKLLNFPSFVLVDNVRATLNVSALAAAITSLQWEDRILGKSEMVKIPIRCGWIFTGNNLSLSSEIARRTVRIKLNAQLDRPWDRDPENFKHPNLLGWVKENRGPLIWAVLTLVQVWISKGCPKSEKTLGSFESWSKVIGGILYANNIPGFLGNLNEFYENSDTEGNVLRMLVTEWYQAYGSGLCGVSELYKLIMRKNIPIELGEKSERSQKIILGKALSRIKDRRFDIELEDAEGNVEKSTFQVTVGRTIKRILHWKLKLCKNHSHDVASQSGSVCLSCQYIDKQKILCCFYAMTGKTNKPLPITEAYLNCPLNQEI